MKKPYGIGISLIAIATMAATVALGGFVPSSAHQDDQEQYPPLPLPPSQVQAKTLFTIPYGPAENEVCEYDVGPGEGDLMTFTVVAFRRLANGNFALLASRPGGGRLQIFNERGELVRSQPMYVYPNERGYHIRSDGVVFWANPIMIEYAIGLGRKEAGVADEVDRDRPPHNPKEPYHIPPEVAVKMPLIVVQASDPEQQAAAQTIQDQIRLQYVEAYRQYRIEEIIGDTGSILAADDGSVHVAIGLPSPGEGMPAEIGTFCFRPNQPAPLIFRPTGANYVILPDNSVGTATMVNLDGAFCATENSKIRVRRLDGSIYAEFLLPKGMHNLFAMPGFGLYMLAGPNRVIWCFRGRPRLLRIERFKEFKTGLGRVMNLVALNREGDVVFHEEVFMPSWSLYDVDNQGNLYYLAYTEQGVEVRMAAIGR